VGALTLLAVLALPTRGWAGGPGKWTKLAQVDNPADTFGMLRTGNGMLHLVWLKKRAANNKQSYGSSAISIGGKLLATGTALANWNSLAPDPRLVRDGSGLRLIFEGNTGSSGCFVDGAVFTETSVNGSSWSLVHGSMSNHTAGVGNLAATTESDGTTPVAAFAAGHLFHIGVDPGCPASSPDGTVRPTPATDTQSFPALATDAHDGSVWVAWFQTFTKEGFWVERILPSQGPPMEAPGSASTASKSNQPLEPVALTARAGGGIYMAYCAISASQPCAHIDLWKVGSKTARVVPGSKNTTNARVALAASPQGRVAVAWYDSAKDAIHMVRTNMTASALGAVQTIKPPAHTSGFNDIQADGSSGRVDILVTDELSTAGAPIDLFHTQILPGLTLKARPKKFSHKAKAKVTFTVTDAGDPLAGVRVSCLGKQGRTAANGQVKLAFPKGAATGSHVCSAGKSGYHGGKATLRVT
jgi:hypothetical protein